MSAVITRMSDVTEEERREKKREAACRWREANPDRARESAARYYEKNKEAIQERARLRYQANPEPGRKATRDAYRADPEKMRERHRQTRERHGARWAETRKQRRAEGKLNADEMRRHATIAQLLESQGGRCYLCNEALAAKDAQIEHDHRCCTRQKTYCSRCTRGAACGPCNIAIAMLRDDPDRIERVAHSLRAKLAEMTHLSA